MVSALGGLIFTRSQFVDNVVGGYLAISYYGDLVVDGSDFYNNTASIVLGSAYGAMAIEDSCFQENSASGLAYAIGSDLAKESNNFAKDNVAFCAGNYDNDADECTIFTAPECRGKTTGGGPACYNESNLALEILGNSSVTGLYTVCAGTVFEDLLVITRSDIIIECEETQTCTFKVSSIPSLYVLNDEELGTITSNVTISGMVFTGYTGEDFIVGVTASDVYFRDCVFMVSYCSCSVIVPCFSFDSQAIRK